MEILELIGFFGALLAGLIMGLIGGGGSILTLPILVYLFSIDTVLATSYSLFIVGFTAFIGTLRNAKSGLIEYKIGLLFSIPALITLFLTRKYIIPALPDMIWNSDLFSLTKSEAILIVFALVMLYSAVAMIRGQKKPNDVLEPKQNPTSLLFYGFLVGLLAGLVGAGGGFLIIPALVFFGKIPMKRAIATSLLIITINSLVGFLGDLHHAIDWRFLSTFTGLSIIGIFVGIYLGKFISGTALKKGFGWFILLMAVYILTKETIF